MTNDNVVNAYATTMISIFQNVVSDYERAQDTIRQTEEELNDVYHEAEFANPKDMYRGYLIYKDIRELRLKRRAAKEQVELLGDLYDFVKSQQGTNFTNAIRKIQGNSAKIRECQTRRTYVPRQRNDLTITNQTCTANKPFEEMLSEFKNIKVSTRGGKLRK